MSWQTILEDDRDPEQPLRQRVEALFEQQRTTWPALRVGEAALAHLNRKTLTSGYQSIVLQENPARRHSTLARTDAASVSSRPCFLCPENMPREERGVSFGNLVILPNPYPILPLHCTIASREHRPQQLAGRINDFLHLADALGPDMVVLYNGSRCGASAPDHFHFQAVTACEIPILAEIPPRESSRPPVVGHTSFERKVIVIRGTALECVEADVDRVIEQLAPSERAPEEPMMNLLAQHVDGQYQVLLFPRTAHRPACYFATGPDRLPISPAILEMCGILVITEPGYFSRIDAVTAEAVYRDVSLPPDQFDQLVNRLS